MREWISTLKSLPNIGQMVLTFNEKYTHYCVQHLFVDRTEKYHHVGDGKYTKENIESAYWSETEPTHWMPLPEPPTK